MRRFAIVSGSLAVILQYVPLLFVSPRDRAEALAWQFVSFPIILAMVLVALIALWAVVKIFQLRKRPERPNSTVARE